MTNEQNKEKKFDLEERTAKFGEDIMAKRMLLMLLKPSANDHAGRTISGGTISNF